ncbi:TetR/AcrR family transcriptional regulator [Brevibacillus ginsengisoli]|uniref:TetR/AcrR family transcriptional regulator n=1 Tax=Brevibacillus ginsengisoli TaxID=363854 RepID=UPI003CF9CDEC
MVLSTKEQITKGALKAFAQYGYNDTTMESIADQAQVAKGTLYYHFKTKEELFLYVNQKGVELLIDSVTRAMKNTANSVEERIICVLDEHLQFFVENKECAFLLINFAIGELNRGELIRSFLANYFSTMEQFIQDLKDQGYVDVELDVHTLVSALFGMIGFTALRKLYRGEQVDTPECKRTLLALLRSALFTGPLAESQ